MTSLVGHDAADRMFRQAIGSGTIHHAWLLVGPRGIGKGIFAREAAKRLLAEAAGEALPPGLSVLEDGRTATLIRAGTHPDYRELVRLPRDAAKDGGDLARSITIAQVRALTGMFATAPSFSPRRVVVIDAIDDLERGGANALLKSLEEPPAGTIFLLVSHAPGRLLPTIRSRCRLLRFEPLDDAAMRVALRQALPGADPAEIDALAEAGEGAPGRALGFAGLDVAGIDQALSLIARDGDRAHDEALKLAKALALKAAQPRYEAFLDRAPSFIVREARRLSGHRLHSALQAYEAARDLAAAARSLSLDQQATVYEMATIVARLAEDPHGV